MAKGRIEDAPVSRSDDPVGRPDDFSRQYDLNDDLLSDPGAETAKWWGA